MTKPAQPIQTQTAYSLGLKQVSVRFFSPNTFARSGPGFARKKMPAVTGLSRVAPSHPPGAMPLATPGPDFSFPAKCTYSTVMVMTALLGATMTASSTVLLVAEPSELVAITL